MIEGARYVHTNLVARDFRALAGFYQDVFGCVVVPPERNYRADELEKSTGVEGVGLEGAHMRLPGHGDNGPTLEIFQYSQQVQTARPSVINPGFAHIAFAVKDVVAAQSEVLRNGGSTVGEVTTVMTSDQRRVKWCYVRDPEGNIIELQTWE